MSRYFHTFRKTLRGRPQPVWLEVVVADSCKKQARAMAEAEMARIKAGLEALKRESEALEKTVREFPDYRFVGAN